MISDTVKFGFIPFKSTFGADGKPNQQGGTILKCGGFPRAIEARNYQLETYFVHLYDSPNVPANATKPVGDPLYVTPKLTIKVIPAIAETTPGVEEMSDEELGDGNIYRAVPPSTRKTPYFEKGISFVVSTEKDYYKSPVGKYPVSLTAVLAPGKITTFDPERHGMNVGQFANPAKPAVTIDGVDYPAIAEKETDLRPGGDMEKRCERWQSYGLKQLRYNYPPFDFSKLANYKATAIFMKDKGFEVMVGHTAMSNGSINKARYDAFKTSILPFVQWAAQSGFKYVSIANEEGNHANRDSTFTMTYIIKGLFEQSKVCRDWLDTNGYSNVVLSCCFSEGERAEVTKQYTEGVEHGLNEFCFNEYDTPINFVTHLADAKAVFGDNLVVTEYGQDRGINDPMVGGTIGVANSGNENEQAIDFMIKKNVLDFFKVKRVYPFCDDDSGKVGGVLDQFGLYVNGRQRPAYTALLSK